MAKSKSPPPYDHGWAWMIVAGSFIALFMSLGLIRSYGMILEQVIDKFNVPTALGVIPITIAALIFAFFSPLFIVLSEVYTPRKVVCFGSTVGVIGIALSSRLFNMPFFIVTFGVSFGIGASTLAGTGPLLISKYFVKRRSIATGLAMSGSSLGQFVMPLLIQYLLDEYALSGALLIMAGLFLQSMISSALYRPIESYDLTPPGHVEEGRGEKSKDIETNVDGNEEDEPFLENQLHVQETSPSGKGVEGSPQTNGEAKSLPQAKNIPEDTTTTTDNHDGEKAQIIANSSKSAPEKPASKKPKFSLKQVFDVSVLKRVDSVFIAVEAFFCYFGLMSFMLFLPGIIREKGFEDYENASLLSMMGIGDLIGRIGSGIVADLGIVKRYRIQSSSVFMAGIASGVCLFLHSYVGLAVTCCCFGLFSGGYMALFAPVVRDFVGPERMAKNFAMGLFLQGVGGATGQPLLGLIKDATGSFSTVLVICCVSCLTGGSLLFCYPVFARLDQKLQNKKQEQSVSD